jgi:hypothetical protein
VTQPRWRFAAAVIAVIVAAAVTIAVGRPEPGPPAPRPQGERPGLLLLTSLPLVFPDQFGLKGGGSPALTALETRYRVVPISVTDRASLSNHRFLLMAHPLAQPAEDLVALDAWVRGGGHLLLLADPSLEWPSSRPLGDPLRPPPMFMDTGLLAHWGLRLDAPDERGPREKTLGGHQILTDSPGRLIGGCAIGEGGLVAHCRIGKGRATIIADADFLDAERLERPANLDALLDELSALEQG